jgi:hypothetical protein
VATYFLHVLPGGHLLPLAQPRPVADYLLQTSRPGGIR